MSSFVRGFKAKSCCKCLGSFLDLPGHKVSTCDIECGNGRNLLVNNWGSKYSLNIEHTEAEKQTRSQLGRITKKKTKKVNAAKFGKSYKWVYKSVLEDFHVIRHILVSVISNRCNYRELHYILDFHFFLRLSPKWNKARF